MTSQRLRELTTQMQERNDYDVVAAGDGLSALALSRGHR